MAQFCTHCGTPETEGETFCTNCGARIGPPPPTTYQRPLAPPPAVPLGGSPARTVPTYGQIGSRIVWSIVGIIFAIIVVIGLLAEFVVHFGDHEDKSPAPIEATAKTTTALPAAAPDVNTQPVPSVPDPPPAMAEEASLTDAQMQKLLARCQTQGVPTKLWQPMVDALGLASPHVVQMVYTEHVTRNRHAFQKESSDGGYVFSATEGDSDDGTAYRTSAQQALIVAVRMQKGSAPVAIPRDEALSGLKAELAFWAAVADTL